MEMDNLPVKKTRAGRPNKFIAEERVKKTAAYLLKARPRTEIQEMLMNDYGLQESSCNIIISNAYKYLAKTHSTDKEATILIHLEHYYDLYNMAKGLGDTRGAVACLNSIEKLLKLTSPEVAVQQNNLSLNLKDLSFNELKELLKLKST